MISFLEVIERAFTGPLCSEKDFNLNNVTRMVREVVKEYGIRYDPAVPVPSDNSLADDVFKAAVKFYSETGTYCPDTQRIMRFDEDEIKEALRDAPNGVILGEKKDARRLVARKPESKEAPFCSVGACGAPIPHPYPRGACFQCCCSGSIFQVWLYPGRSTPWLLFR